jgi:3-phosphoglycerate kinase
VGVFEFEQFATGSKTCLMDLVAATKRGAITVLGTWCDDACDGYGC